MSLPSREFSRLYFLYFFTFIVHFISIIITSAPHQIISHWILEVRNPCHNLYACLLQTGSNDRNNGLINRIAELIRKQQTSEVKVAGRTTDSPRMFYIIILYCEIMLDYPTTHSIPLTGGEVRNFKKRVCKRCLVSPVFPLQCLKG